MIGQCIRGGNGSSQRRSQVGRRQEIAGRGVIGDGKVASVGGAMGSIIGNTEEDSMIMGELGSMPEKLSTISSTRLCATIHMGTDVAILDAIKMRLVERIGIAHGTDSFGGGVECTGVEIRATGKVVKVGGFVISRRRRRLVGIFIQGANRNVIIDATPRVVVGNTIMGIVISKGPATLSQGLETTGGEVKIRVVREQGREINEVKDMGSRRSRRGRGITDDSRGVTRQRRFIINDSLNKREWTSGGRNDIDRSRSDRSRARGGGRDRSKGK